MMASICQLGVVQVPVDGASDFDEFGLFYQLLAQDKDIWRHPTTERLELKSLRYLVAGSETRHG
jgi:hypothetical protein